MGRLSTRRECRGGAKKSYSPHVISRFAEAITKSHLNANKLDGQNETGLKRLNLQIIPVIKQEKGHT